MSWPALVTVASGELTMVDSHDCEVRRYRMGRSFMDAGEGRVDVRCNSSETETVVYVTYLYVPAGQSPPVSCSNPGC